MSFANLGVDLAVCEAIKAAFAIEEPSDIQANAIREILQDDARRDILIQSKTGSGKTLAFLLPLIHQLLIQGRSLPRSEGRRLAGTQAMVVVPTRELAAQTQQVLSKLLLKLHGPNHWIVSGMLSGGDRRKVEKERLRKGLHIVVGTPGRIVDHLHNTEKWSKQVQSTCRWLVLDEADRLMDLGFERFLKQILDHLLGERVADQRPQIIFCSATVKEQLSEFVGHPLVNPLLIKGSARKTTGISPCPEQLEQFVLCCPTRLRLAVLLAFLDDAFSRPAAEGKPICKMVLFTICCDTVDYLFSILGNVKLNLLRGKTIKLFKLHGNLEHRERIATFQAFSNECHNESLLLCTDVAARGLNLENVTCIVQYDAPCDMNDYIHRAGRTARLHQTGKSLLYLMPSERDYISALEGRGLKLKRHHWEELLERLACKIGDIKGQEGEADFEEEEQYTMINDQNAKGHQNEEHFNKFSLSTQTRQRILNWMQALQLGLKKEADLYQMANRAFLSFVRAYATHATDEKSIFHIKKLHLGHLAASFLLAEPPKAVAAKQRTLRQGEKGNGADPHTSRQRKVGQRKRPVSEFDAGEMQNRARPRNLR